MPRRDVRTHYGRTKWQFRRIKRHEERTRSQKDAIKSKMHYDERRLSNISRRDDVSNHLIVDETAGFLSLTSEQIRKQLYPDNLP